MDPFALVVATRLEPELYRSTVDRQLLRKEVTPVGVNTEGHNRIDLVGAVPTVNDPVATATAAPAADDDDVAAPASPFALNAQEFGSKVQHKLVALVVEWTGDADPSFKQS